MEPRTFTVPEQLPLPSPRPPVFTPLGVSPPVRPPLLVALTGLGSPPFRPEIGRATEPIGVGQPAAPIGARLAAMNAELTERLSAEMRRVRDRVAEVARLAMGEPSPLDEESPPSAP